VDNTTDTSARTTTATQTPCTIRSNAAHNYSRKHKLTGTAQLPSVSMARF
jgi:hypothetical protein